MILLCLDTATEYAGACISKDGTVLAKRESEDPKNHGAFIQPAIQELCVETGISLTAIHAIAVTAGPGSYTGIRVGMASAKGICFALNKPLITLNTLAVIAYAAKNESSTWQKTDCLVYPMIDARRKEVFTGIYSSAIEELQSPNPLVLTNDYLASIQSSLPILFCGNGAKKIPTTPTKLQYGIHSGTHTVEAMVSLAERAFAEKRFADLAYVEPIYAKAFHDTRK